MHHSFDIQFAQVYGIPEAILIQHFDFWLTKNKANNKNFREGTYWTYCTMQAMSEIFPYFTVRQIKYAVKKLKDLGVIQIKRFNQQKRDQTNWYSFTEMFLNSPCASKLQFCTFVKTIKSTKLSSAQSTNLSHAQSTNSSSLNKGSDLKKNLKKDIIPAPQKNDFQEGSPDEIWRQILNDLEGRISRSSFNTWLRPTTILSVTDNAWVIGIPDDTFKYWIEQYYAGVIKDAIRTMIGAPVKVEFQVVQHE